MRWRVRKPRRRVRRHDPTTVGSLPTLNGTLDDAYEMEAYPETWAGGEAPK